jgi:pyridoxine 4-dehydrogenase
LTDHANSPLKSAGTITLGELTVKRLGYGAMRLTGPGVWGPPEDRSAAIAVLRKAVELGVNFIDTADSYGPDVNEELIAEALSPYPKDLVIATKGGWIRTAPGIWAHNATPSHLRKAVEGSLKRLRRERIDVYQLHIPDPVVSFEESVARKIVSVVSVQNRYSFADREWDYVVDYCEQNGIAFIPWFPLGAGTVAKETVQRIADAHGAKPMQVALAWLLQRSPLMLPIPGTSSVEHLEENMRAGSLRLTGEEFAELAAVPELVFTR